MRGRTIKMVAGAVALTTAFADVAAAQAPAPPTYGGGGLPQAASLRTYTPSVNLSLQPRGDRIAMIYDSSLLCGRDVIEIAGGGEAAFDGTNFSFGGSAVKRLTGGRLTYTWTVTGQISGGGGAGTLHVIGIRRISGRTRRCARTPDRAFAVRIPVPPAGGPAQPGPRAFYAGTIGYEIFDRIQAPVILRATKDARKISAQWSIAGKCGRGPREHFVNFTPPTTVRPDGTFSRNERFSIRYADVVVRYRPSFSGRIRTDGATGTLRLRTRIYNRRGTKLLTRCDSGGRNWNAAPA